MQVVANGDLAGTPGTAANLADLLSLDADDAAATSATASSAVTALQDLLSGDLSAEVAAAGNTLGCFCLIHTPAVVFDSAALDTKPYAQQLHVGKASALAVSRLQYF